MSYTVMLRIRHDRASSLSFSSHMQAVSTSLTLRFPSLHIDMNIITHMCIHTSTHTDRQTDRRHGTADQSDPRQTTRPPARKLPGKQAGSRHDALNLLKPSSPTPQPPHFVVRGNRFVLTALPLLYHTAEHIAAVRPTRLLSYHTYILLTAAVASHTHTHLLERVSCEGQRPLHESPMPLLHITSNAGRQLATHQPEPPVRHATEGAVSIIVHTIQRRGSF